MKIIDTSQLSLEGGELTSNEAYWVYNGLDCCITAEVRESLKQYFDPVSRAVYEKSLRLQGPLLDMMLRGVQIDPTHVRRTLHEFEEKLAKLESMWARLCVEGLGLPAPINWRSHVQVKELFYGVLCIPPIRKRTATGKMGLASDRETLEKLTKYFVAEPFANFILAMRDAGKSIGFLKTPLDEDGRIRCNFNIAGTDTGRLSSSFSDFGTGTNLQNIDRNLRNIFVPDAGKVFINIDLEQADSRNVGALCWEMFYDATREDIAKALDVPEWHGPIGAEFAGAYLDACESGDLHTFVCRMAWTELPWGDDPTKWRGIADGIAYRTYSFRDMAKKLGHGTNYLGQPKTMASHTKVPQEQIATFQQRYFSGFPCIKAWQNKTIEILRTTGQLTHLFGRRRFFFNRLDDQSTYNAAIAYSPQGMTGEEINEGLMNLWLDPRFELLIQVHDSILLQVDEKQIDTLVPLALELLRVERTLKGGRKFCVPLEAEVGWNWGKRDEKKNRETGVVTVKNPLGLTKWKGSETRTPPTRRPNVKRLSIMDYL